MEPEPVRLIMWAEGDYFTCRRDGAELLVKRTAASLVGPGPYYPVCPWCGCSMDIVTLQKEVDDSQEERKP